MPLPDDRDEVCERAPLGDAEERGNLRRRSGAIVAVASGAMLQV